jgi:hypothetical protein
MERLKDNFAAGAYLKARNVKNHDAMLKPVSHAIEVAFTDHGLESSKTYSGHFFMSLREIKLKYAK